MLVALAAIWGASFLFIAIAVDDLGAVGISLARVLLAALGLLIWAAAHGGVPRMAHRWRGYLGLGALNAALPFALIAAAELTIPASLAAIVNATAPLFSAVIAALWLGQRIDRLGGLGLLLGLAGVGLVVGLAPIGSSTATFLAVGASLGAAAAYAAGGHLVKLRFATEPPMTLAIGQQLGASMVAAPCLLVVPPRHVPGLGPVAAVLVLGLVCTGLAYLIYFRLIAELGATSALTVTYLVPVFGVLWAALFLGERITAGMLAGAAVVLAGVLLVTGTGRAARSVAPSASTGPPHWPGGS